MKRNSSGHQPWGVSLIEVMVSCSGFLRFFFSPLSFNFNFKDRLGVVLEDLFAIGCA